MHHCIPYWYSFVVPIDILLLIRSLLIVIYINSIANTRQWSCRQYFTPNAFEFIESRRDHCRAYMLSTLFTTLWYFIVNKTISRQYHLEYDKEPFVRSKAKKYSDNSTLIVDNHKQKANLCMNAPSICSKCHHTNTLIIINNSSNHPPSFIIHSFIHLPFANPIHPFAIPIAIPNSYASSVSCKKT